MDGMFFAAALLAGIPALADSITADGKTYDNVYVVEGGAMYYIQFPDTGKVTCVRKIDVPRGQVRLTQDTDARAALRDRWSANNDRLVGRPSTNVAAPAKALGMAALGQVTPATEQKRRVPHLYVPAPSEDHGDKYATDGMVPYVKLENVPLKLALKGILRPLNLDYKVEDGYIWISTPDKIRTESFETPETRYYALKSAGADTLPKIVVGNPGGGGASMGPAATGFGGGIGAGLGGVGNAGSALGGGGLGGLAGGAYGGGGGGYGGGGGMGGGGYAGGGAVSPGFSNISQLFGTIDDRLVETPAVIGLAPMSLGGSNANYAANTGQRSTSQPLGR